MGARALDFYDALTRAKAMRVDETRKRAGEGIGRRFIDAAGERAVAGMVG